MTREGGVERRGGGVQAGRRKGEKEHYCGTKGKIAQNGLKIRLTYEVPRRDGKVGGGQVEVASDFKISH